MLLGKVLLLNHQNCHLFLFQIVLQELKAMRFMDV